MQNRFKFRVWNKARQCFMTEKEIFICGNGELVLIDEALSRTWVKDNPNYKVSFCTGLKDKNGKLIYEGDVVKFGEFYDNEWNSFDIGKVYWGGKFDYPAFELQCSTVDFDMSNGLSYIFGNGWDIEVIGNIYENSELLEVEND